MGKICGWKRSKVRWTVVICSKPKPTPESRHNKHWLWMVFYRYRDPLTNCFDHFLTCQHDAYAFCTWKQARVDTPSIRRRRMPSAGEKTMACTRGKAPRPGNTCSPSRRRYECHGAPFVSRCLYHEFGGATAGLWQRVQLHLTWVIDHSAWRGPVWSKTDNVPESSWQGEALLERLIVKYPY